MLRSTSPAALASTATAAVIATFWFTTRVWSRLKTGGKDLTLGELRAQLQKNPQLAAQVVAHRGWHYPSDDLSRPLENTLPAYERAWSSGIRHCECDVTLTKDGEVILCHDNDLKRLALRPENVKANVDECDFENNLELFPLKDGSRVPRLIEVLQAAKRSGMGSKLVIEIKGEDAECARRVGEIIGTELGDYVAVVMGFSLLSVKEFAACNPRRGQVLSMLLTTRRQNAGSRLQYFDLHCCAEAEQVIRDNLIDGLYLQYGREFVDDRRFIDLCKRIPIGVWGRAIFDPDDEKICTLLISRGAKFVNSDFPDAFFSKASL